MTLGIPYIEVPELPPEGPVRINREDIVNRRYDLMDRYTDRGEHVMEGVRIESMFGFLEFTKLGTEIIEKATAKVDQVKAKIAERQTRIKDVCEKYNITASDLFALARMYSGQGGKVRYDSLSMNDAEEGEPQIRRDIPAGKVAEIGQESSLIEAEKRQVEKLSLIVRNLNPSKLHKITYDELQYLGF